MLELRCRLSQIPALHLLLRQEDVRNPGVVQKSRAQKMTMDPKLDDMNRYEPTRKGAISIWSHSHSGLSCRHRTRFTTSSSGKAAKARTKEQPIEDTSTCKTTAKRLAADHSKDHTTAERGFHHMRTAIEPGVRMKYDEIRKSAGHRMTRDQFRIGRVCRWSLDVFGKTGDGKKCRLATCWASSD